MIFSTPDPALLKFIADNSLSDLCKLRLKYHGKDAGFDVDFALIQIKCRRKCSHKLRNFTNNKLTIFPSVIAAEQSSHEAVASFHASFVGKDWDVIDMTAGLGIDSMAMAKKCRMIVSCESDQIKANALSYNAKISGIDNLLTENTDSVKYITGSDRHYDLIFVDPARRGEENARLYNFHDCQPDILSIMPMLLERGSKVMIKASPLLDITQTIRDIPSISSIRAISVNGECKEILVETGTGTSTILAEAIDLHNNGDIISRFSYGIVDEANGKHDEDLNNSFNEDSSFESSQSAVRYAGISDIKPDLYLYEPNAPMMKLSPWGELSQCFPTLSKLAPSSHLFISPDLIPDFPGRILKIVSLPDKKDRKALKDFPVNIVSRNYPLSAVELRKKLKAKEGKEKFLYASRVGSTPILILTDKIRI